MAATPPALGTGERRRRLIIAPLLAILACTTTPPGPVPPDRPASPIAPAPVLQHTRLDPASVRVEAEGLTVESSFLLKLYTWLHARDYRSYRIHMPAAESADEDVIAHLLVPSGDLPRPAIVVFPILAGSHVISEALAKALVGRGYVVARMERRALDLEEAQDPGHVATDFAASIREGRRLLDWLVTRPEVDPDRIASAGVSLGGMLSCLLLGVDERVRAGFFIMAGGGLPELLYDSAEGSVRAFREQLLAERQDRSREAFLAWMRGYTEDVEPLRYAPGIAPGKVLLASARFDRVVPRERSIALREALGNPTWIQLPAGHHLIGPFFWWTVGRGTDHLDRIFGLE